MADSKISALPASTTPLAGTEVLPIVQSSTTKQVSIANLTAGRAISATSIQFGSGTVLSTYEQGTWTVVWTSLTGTPASTTGYYTKIGRMVYFTYSTGSGSITATAGSTRFSLPFAPAIEASGTQISQNVNFSFTTLLLPANSSSYVGTFTSNFMVFSGAYHV
jgi:hypothetical protein